MNAPAQENSHQLAAPSKKAMLASLIRLLPEDKAEELWRETCESLSIDTDTAEIKDLSAIAGAIAENEGVLGLIGRSLTVRIRTYTIISRTNKFIQK